MRGTPSSVLLREITLLCVFVGMAVVCGAILVFDEVNRVAPDSTILSILTFILGVLARDFGSTGTQSAVAQATQAVSQASAQAQAIQASVTNGTSGANGGTGTHG